MGADKNFIKVRKIKVGVKSQLRNLENKKN